MLDRPARACQSNQMMNRWLDHLFMPGLVRQFAAFAGVGIMAAVVHYGALIGLVEGAAWRPVPATLIGYTVGGILSYVLNRRHVFASSRPHHEASWRFGGVAAVGFCLTYGFMHLLVDWLNIRYLIAQILTTAIVLFWSFLANRFWTFAVPNGWEG
jgi:putative flippase GtrA